MPLPFPRIINSYHYYHHHHHLFWKKLLSSTLELGSDVCPRVDNQTSGDTIQDSTWPLSVKNRHQPVIHPWSVFPHQPVQIREETLECGNLFSGCSIIKNWDFFLNCLKCRYQFSKMKNIEYGQIKHMNKQTEKFKLPSECEKSKIHSATHC